MNMRLSLKCVFCLIWMLLVTVRMTAAQTNDSPELIASRELNSKVIKLYGEGKYDEALPLAKRALELREEALGTSHEDIIPLLTNLGELYRAKRKFGDARSSFERALAIAEKAFGPDDIRIAHIADMLGLIAYEQHQTKDAASFFERSLAIKDKRLSPGDVETAPTLFNLAELYRLRGDYEKAEPLYERLVGIREKAPGKDNADLERAVEGYVTTLLALKKTAEANAVQERLSRLFSSQGMVRGGVLNGRAVKLVQPEYPLVARTDRASAMVRVRVVIDETGRVISAKTINSEPVHPALAAAAENAARHSVFTPTYLSGVAVKVSGIIVYNFIAQ